MHTFVRVAVALAALSLPAQAREFVAQAGDFDCLRNWPKVHHTRVFNKNPKALRKAMRIIEKGKPHKHFPVGTILQLWPGEASVKRGGRFNRAGNGWEFFALKTGADGTTIVDRGLHTKNVFNHSECVTCHAAAKSFDFFCEHAHGCDELGVPEVFFDNQQEGDVRCQPAH